MKIRVVGLNHKTAPLAVREKLTFGAVQVETALAGLRAQFGETEFVLLSTCNRTELYLAARTDRLPREEDLIGFLGEFGQVKGDPLRDYFYVFENEAAVGHLLTVASSLDSLVVGESQIVAQVKESYRRAVAGKYTGKVLNRLFHCAFATSKEVYTLTSIAQRRVSVAGVAIELAGQLFAELARAEVAVIGAGEMGELLVRHLQEEGCRVITVFNRTFRRAEAMAKRYGIQAGPWEELTEALGRVDIVVAAATADDYLFDRSMLEGRREGTLLIIDIAVPRNFAPEVNELDDVYLYSVDDLASVIRENIETRQEDVGQARVIIADNVESFMDWFGVKDIGPMIGMLRSKFHEISRGELERFMAGEEDMGLLPRRKMEAAVNRIVDRLLHRLISNFHSMARDYGTDEAKHLIQSIIDYKDRTECPGREEDTERSE